MTMARRAPTATLLPDGRVLIAAGYGSAALYDPPTGIFTATGHMTTGRQYQTATLLLDGKVLIAGGLGFESNPLWTAELYDLQTGTFTATGDMTTASILVFNNSDLQQGRVFHTSTLLPDGKVLMAGGWANYGPGHEDLASAELYDPLAGTFSATGDMATGRSLHTATLLNDGRVLIAGGIENYLAFSGIPGVPALPKVLESAELYHPPAASAPPLALGAPSANSSEVGISGAPQRRRSPVGEGPTQGGCWLNLVACERPSRETGKGGAS
jgi:hypothetical protein